MLSWEVLCRHSFNGPMEAERNVPDRGYQLKRGPEACGAFVHRTFQALKQTNATGRSSPDVKRTLTILSNSANMLIFYWSRCISPDLLRAIKLSCEGKRSTAEKLPVASLFCRVLCGVCFMPWRFCFA